MVDIKIRKVRNPYGITKVFVPNKDTEEARRANKNEWQARLFSELDYYHTRKRWNIGFLTLTYNSQCLPTIPGKFFVDGEYERIPCFSYSDIKAFFSCIRSYLFRQYHMTNVLRWFLTCEYGEQYHRPHYHAMLIFDSRISHEEMWQLCSDAWRATTFKIPNNSIRKRRIDHGRINEFNDFIPEDTYGCGAYVAKYVCKDIEFFKVIDGKFNHLSRKSKNHLRHFMPFHKQSLAFGSCMIEGKSDDELLEMYNEGIQFTGQGRRVELPLYLKNKILFGRYRLYNVNTHKYESMKVYTKWFYDHKEEVYRKKVKQNSGILKQFVSADYWRTREVEGADNGRYLVNCRSIVNSVGIEELSRFYTCYYGVPYKACKVYENMSDALFSRYNPIADNEDREQLDLRYYNFMNNCIGYLMNCASLSKPEVRRKCDDLYDRVRAFFNKEVRYYDA